MLIKGMSVIFQRGFKQVLFKHCDYIASSLEVVGSGSNEPLYCGLNEPLAGIVRFYRQPSATVLMLIKGMSVNTIHVYSGITSGRVHDGELLYTKILESLWNVSYILAGF